MTSNFRSINPLKVSVRLLCALTFLLAASAAHAQGPFVVQHQSPGGGTLWDITDGGAGLIAVGTGGIIMHSQDGQNWTEVESGTTVWLVAVAFAEGRYIAVGEGGVILQSLNGVDWMAVAEVPTAQRLNNISYDRNLWVIVGEAGTILTSSDAVTWTAMDSPTTAWLRALAYSPLGSAEDLGVWLAAGEGGVVVASNDGMNWTLPSYPEWSPNDGQDIESLAFNFVGVSAIRSDHLQYYSFTQVGQDGAISSRNYSRRWANPGEPGVWKETTSKSLSKDPGTQVRLRSVANLDSVTIAVGDTGTIVTLRGDNNFELNEIDSTASLVGSGIGLDALFAVGEDLTIVKSQPIVTSRLVNLSTRGSINGGIDGSMIAGVVVAGTEPKPLLVRAMGPSLAEFGVTGYAPDPQLRMFDAGNALIAENQRWNSDPSKGAEIVASASGVGAFSFQDTDSLDSAILTEIQPGIFTSQISTESEGGVVLSEVYDLESLAVVDSYLTNLSARGHVGVGEQILIGGFSVQGDAAMTLLLRGVGPTLENFEVPNTLSNPTLRLFTANQELIAENDDWHSHQEDDALLPEADRVAAIANQVGAFPLESDSTDAAMIVRVIPGNYTVTLSGRDDDTGEALLEIYVVE